MSSKITRSEQLKRKSYRKQTKEFETDESGGDDDDYDEDKFYLVTFEEKEGKKDFAIVKASDVGVLANDHKKGIYKYRGKSYIVDILKEGKTFFKEAYEKKSKILIFFSFIKKV